ncbi:MAG TPA: hypothetical protein VN922_06195 [Bacteroidia bacterium]|nr:hypothetical protein [Bacteroidia bacterium]
MKLILGVFSIIVLIMNGCKQNNREHDSISNSDTLNVVKDKGEAKKKSSKASGNLDTAYNHISAYTKSYSLRIGDSNNYVVIDYKNSKKHNHISFISPPPNITCHALAIVTSTSAIGTNFKSYYIYNDSILLLPVISMQGTLRIGLYVINLFSQQLLEGNDSNDAHFTSLPCIVFNKKTGVFAVSNTLSTDEDLSEPTGVNFYKISSNHIIYLKQVNFVLSSKINNDSVYLKKIVKKIRKLTSK